ncbi:MAG: DAK2 domain-containing protein [Chloroflexi bacterium]|nr:DAK2 domain-containing protein [Chloroflexota bacterium]
MATSPDDRTAPSSTPSPATAATARTLDGPLLRSLFTDASTLLHRHADALNAINVFPVPDGDTGVNMHLTLRAAIEAMENEPGSDLAASAQALAHGALMGARGNSGVILSQILRGLASGFAGHRDADGATLAAALTNASDAAYAALAEPKEGTILTVIRAAAEAAAAAASPKATIEEVLARATAAAHEAVERTPELLPVLREAGVVDAGGLGLAIILEGLLRSLRHDSLDVDLAPEAPPAAGWQGEAATLHQARHGESGYCTEFIVGGSETNAGDVRSHLVSLGGSVLVVGDSDLLRVHVHTKQPDDALAYGRTLGEVTNVKVENMDAQVERFAAAGAPVAPVAGIGIVAVVAGEGLEAAFFSLGVTQVVHGGQTMNPSAGDILAAIEACDQDYVVTLPNNQNIIAASEQAAEQSSKQVKVLPSRSVPQGIAAALALSPDLSFEENVASMRRAMDSVRSAEVTRAAKPGVIDGRKFQTGQAIGLVDGSLQVVADDIAAAALACIEKMHAEDTSLLTLYTGSDVRDEEASALAAELRARYPGLEIELVAGGQPHYPYLISLE